MPVNDNSLVEEVPIFQNNVCLSVCICLLRITGLCLPINLVRELFNPLLQEFFFPSVFEIWPKIGCYRLPTHRRGAHTNFFDDPFLF